MACDHRNLHPARIDICATVCLDCGRQVNVQPFQYADGTTSEEQARRMWAKCQEQIPLAMRQPEFLP